MIGNPLDAHLTETELLQKLEERKIRAGSRTLRNWRQRRIGPPFAKMGRTVIYPMDGFARWLEAGTQRPRR
jgi:hypothetical protein